MATLEVAFLHSQLEVRKRRLEAAITLAPQEAGFVGLLREVDSALERMAKGSYGLCQECHETIEQDRLLADPLVRYCLDHLTESHHRALWRPCLRLQPGRREKRAQREPDRSQSGVLQRARHPAVPWPDAECG